MSSTAPHQALYRRWRAQTFTQIVGQEAVVETLRNAVRLNQVAHALLFVGPRGTGKTSMARIVAKAINCTNLQDGDPCDTCEACVSIREGRALDVTEMDAASNNRVDDMRELLERTYTAPSDLRRKVYIVDEVQRITQGWDVLLRTLEEPPDHVAFIFCTTDASQIRPAVLSRVQRFDFRRLTIPEIEGKLTKILAAGSVEAEPEAITLIARLAAGGMRDAESILDQLLSSGAERLTEAQVRDLLGLADSETISRFVAALVDGNPLAGMGVLDDLEDRGRDFRTFLDQVVEVLRATMVAGLAAARGDPSSSLSLTRLSGAARRLAEVDPARANAGGLRFQIELALLAAPDSAPSPSVAAVAEPSKPSASPKVSDAAPRERVSAATGARASAHRVEDVMAPQADRVSADAPAADMARPEQSKGTAPSPKVTPPAGPAGPAGDTDALEQLRRSWPEIVTLISQHPPTKPLISACRPISVEGNVVTLGFPEGQAFLKDVAERRRTILEEGVGKFLGRAVAVRCVATNLDLVPPIPGDDEGSKLLTEARRIFADDLVDVGEVS